MHMIDIELPGSLPPNNEDNLMTIMRRMLALSTFVLALAPLAAFSDNHDPINAAKQDDKRAGSAAPGIEETRAIAEEGFIYGLPIVMNYATMYEFVVDKNSGQYKGPFNQIANEARVFTWQDTTIVTPNSDTPYSMLWLDLRAEPMVISVPAVPAPRYYSVQLVDGNTFNYGYIGSRATGPEAGDYMVVGPGWTDRRPEKHRPASSRHSPPARILR